MGVETLTANDQAALQKEITLGKRICGFYMNDVVHFDLTTVDRVFDLWLHDPRQQKPSGNEICLGLGSLIGEFISKRFALRWVVISDQSGSDLAIQNDRNNWQCFPRHWVAKRLRIENANQKIFETLVETLKEQGCFA